MLKKVNGQSGEEPRPELVRLTLQIETCRAHADSLDIRNATLVSSQSKQFYV